MVIKINLFNKISFVLFLILFLESYLCPKKKVKHKYDNQYIFTNYTIKLTIFSVVINNY